MTIIRYDNIPSVASTAFGFRRPAAAHKASMMKKLVIATHNKGKLAELRMLLAACIPEITSAGELGLPEPDETGRTFEQNALLKAHAAAKASGLPALADDSGLCITALNGAPGVDTANWTKRGLEGLTELHEQMGNNPNRSAQSVCVLALAWPDGCEQVFDGRVNGTLVWPPRGENGFGYDPFFRPDGHDRVYAEMSREEKSAISHRRKALDLLIAYLETANAGV